MKLTDYLAKTLKQWGISHVFGVTGGAAVHLFDSADQAGIQCVFTHHEQTAAYAACAYAREKRLGAAFFTTGPGCTNAFTGIASAWLDSIPVLYVAGQVRSNHSKPSTIRQQGAQELDIVSLVTPITNYAKTLKHPEDLAQELATCFTMATQKRPGPVYLEIPLDFQWAEIPDTALQSKTPQKTLASQDQVQLLCQKIQEAQAPLFFIGQGVKLAGASLKMQQLLHTWQVPFLSTWNAADGLDTQSPLYLGSSGMFGTRQANIAVQACDFLCCIGTHLPIAVTTAHTASFAKNAETAVINIDSEELKHQRITPTYRIAADAKDFLCQIEPFLQNPLGSSSWRESCTLLRKQFFREKAKQQANKLHMYTAVDALFSLAGEEDTFVIDGGGTVVQASMQSVALQKKQKLIIDAGLCSMGSGLPHAIGAAFAKKKGQVVGLCGDGSFQFNIQELQTLFHYQLPIKFFVFNNQGYLSIRHTQKGFLEKRYLGSSAKGGISLPSILAVSKAYRIPCLLITSMDQLEEGILKTFAHKGPYICEILIPSEDTMQPRAGFTKDLSGKFTPNPLEQMDPAVREEDLPPFFQKSLNKV